MSLQGKRTCPVCQTKFAPTVDWQVCDTAKCATALRVRRFRARKRCGGGDDGGGPGRRPQLGLFPKPPKPAKRVRVPEPTLFPDDAGGLLATLGGAVTLGGEDGQVPITSHSRYSVKSDRPKPCT